MSTEFIYNVTVNSFKGLGNTFLNGFPSDISEEDKTIRKIGLKLAHFCPLNKWSWERNDDGTIDIIDCTTGDKYFEDSAATVRLKCAAVFVATWLIQPIGLTLNILNKIAKIVTFAHLWAPSEEEYHFTARLGEWGKDILRIVSTPLIWVGMIFSSFYGAIISPYDGRKLYGSFERLIYSGGYQFFNIDYDGRGLHSYLLTPCFQPEPKAHLGGGALDQSNAW